MFNIFRKTKKILNFKLISNKKLFICILVFVPLFIIGYSVYFLSKNTVKMNIPEITAKQKGSFIDIYIPPHLYGTKLWWWNFNTPSDSIMVDGSTLTLLPGNKVLYLVAGRAIIFDFENKIAYTNYYLPFLGYPINSPQFYYSDDINSVSLPDGKVYFFGIEKAEMFNSRLNKFYTIASMLRKRSYITSTLLPNKEILIAGGYINQNKLSEAELYDPQLNRYTAVSNMNAKRFHHTATLLKNGKVLIVGGNDKNEPYAELYDYKTGKFYPLVNNGKTRYDHSATLLQDGRVIIIGGNDGNGKYYSDVEIYDPQINKFKEIGHLISPKYKHSAILLKSYKIFIAGSDYTGYANDTYCHGELYDLNTNKSSKILDLKNFTLPNAIMLKDSNILMISNYYLDDENKIKLYIP